MKTITFDYTKADGKTSKRVLVVTKDPSIFVHGQDITELSMEDQALYIQALNTAHEEYVQRIEAINEEFDMRFKYRQFDPSRMENIIQENI